MSHLLRSHAPITDMGWKLLDEEARQRSTPALAARKLVDFSGPHGWDYSATNLGRTKQLAAWPREGVSGLQRRVLPLVELRADFALSRAELRDADRGADDIDLRPLDVAAHEIAVTENVAVFHGWQGAITGIDEASPYPGSEAGGVDERLPATGRRRHRAAPLERGWWAVWVGLRYRAIPSCHRDRRARGVPAPSAPPQDPRRPHGVVAGREGCGRPQLERRRFRAR